MAKKTPIDQLQSSIDKILAEYGDDVKANVSDIAQEIAKKGAQALRNASTQEFGSGQYAKGWKVENQNSARGLAFSSVIYNNTPGLPHLLEYGHVTRNGTDRTYPRTPAHEHIAPIEAELTETFEREVKSKL